jgi:hypothetical protein
LACLVVGAKVMASANPANRTTAEPDAEAKKIDAEEGGDG